MRRRSPPTAGQDRRAVATLTDGGAAPASFLVSGSLPPLPDSSKQPGSLFAAGAATGRVSGTAEGWILATEAVPMPRPEAGDAARTPMTIGGRPAKSALVLARGPEVIALRRRADARPHRPNQRERKTSGVGDGSVSGW